MNHLFFLGWGGNWMESDDEQKSVLVSACPPQKIPQKLPLTETLNPQPPNMLINLSGWRMKDICLTNIKKIKNRLLV